MTILKQPLSQKKRKLTKNSNLNTKASNSVSKKQSTQKTTFSFSSNHQNLAFAENV